MIIGMKELNENAKETLCTSKLCRDCTNGYWHSVYIGVFASGNSGDGILYTGILSVGLLPVTLCILTLQSMAFFSRGVSSVVFCAKIDTLSACSYWALHTLNFVSILVMKILISANSVFKIFFSFQVITINLSHWCYYSVYLCNQTSPRECIQNSHRQSRICDI